MPFTPVRRRTRLPLLLAAGALLVGGTALDVPDAKADAAHCKATELFVAPDGSDRAKGTRSRPFKTVEKARDHIRDKGLNRPGRMRCDIHVNLRAGDYPLSRTVDLDDRDSGSGGHRVVYRSYDGPGKARVTGAEPVTGWTEYKDGVYRADVGTDQPFYTLFEDGKRATTARYPNRGSDDTWSPYLTSVLSEPEKEAVHQWLYSNPGEWDADWNLDNAQVVIWSGGSWSWFTDTVPIRDWNAAKNQMTLKHWTRYALINSRGGSRYFLQNSLDFLDQAGEYYMDFKKGQLYYKPKGDIDDVTVLRPTVKTLFNLAAPAPTGASRTSPSTDSPCSTATSSTGTARAGSATATRVTGTSTRSTTARSRCPATASAPSRSPTARTSPSPGCTCRTPATTPSTPCSPTMD